MPNIDPRLIGLLQKRMNVAIRTVYAAIQKTAAANRVPRDLGALLLAGENGISYQRYATADQMAALRGAPAQPFDTVPRQPAKRQAPAQRRVVVASANNNSIFVVHGRDSQLNADMFAFLRSIGLDPLEWSQAIKDVRGAKARSAPSQRGGELMRRAASY